MRRSRAAPTTLVWSNQGNTGAVAFSPGYITPLIDNSIFCTKQCSNKLTNKVLVSILDLSAYITELTEHNILYKTNATK